MATTAMLYYALTLQLWCKPIRYIFHVGQKITLTQKADCFYLKPKSFIA